MTTLAKPPVVICDYGVGNLRSVERALENAGATASVSGDPSALRDAALVVLPGVGAFGPAARRLRDTGLADAIGAAALRGTLIFGVCLGMQLLYAHSDESDDEAGLSLLAGGSRRLRPGGGLKVPHMGWNQVEHRDPLFDGIAQNAYMYFVHSYAADPGGDTIASCDYGGPVVAACRQNNVMGTQFHPEKSGTDGLRLYRNLVEMAR